MKCLLKGGKVPLIKTTDNWHYSLSGMLDYATDTTEVESVEGFSYEDYLRMLLHLLSEEKRTMRSLDIVEMNVRKEPYNSGFRLDTCIDYLVIQVFVGTKYKTTLDITREYYYL